MTKLDIDFTTLTGIWALFGIVLQLRSSNPYILVSSVIFGIFTCLALLHNRTQYENESIIGPYLIKITLLATMTLPVLLVLFVFETRDVPLFLFLPVSLIGWMGILYLTHKTKDIRDRAGELVNESSLPSTDFLTVLLSIDPQYEEELMKPQLQHVAKIRNQYKNHPQEIDPRDERRLREGMDIIDGTARFLVNAAVVVFYIVVISAGAISAAWYDIVGISAAKAAFLTFGTLPFLLGGYREASAYLGTHIEHETSIEVVGYTYTVIILTVSNTLTPTLYFFSFIIVFALKPICRVTALLVIKKVGRRNMKDKIERNPQFYARVEDKSVDEIKEEYGIDE